MIAINPVLADRADDFENWPRNFVLTASPLLNSFCFVRRREVKIGRVISSRIHEDRP